MCGGILEVLTPRQAEIARLICGGLQNGEIARRLSISRSTVRHHLAAIGRRLGTQDRQQLIIVLFGRGWVDPQLALAELEPQLARVVRCNQYEW